ncbi:creatine kinase B-type-like [Actinia tenebrosa]|uniref:Creatine kinase B-type-like n=1 Tax=Actinia tenebrosa TaxID=6105 RepID=A0A6P8IX70_ACTTE|nr:creatine kinase B-type-like [Actinia tenebrosa]
MEQESNITKRLLALTALGCGVYLSKEFYNWWRKRENEWRTERKGNDGYMRHPAYDSYPDLSIHNNLMARYLTPEVYEALKDKETPEGVTLEKVIQIGVRCPGMPWERASGVIAGDENSYHVFALLFDKIIKELHEYGPEEKHARNLDCSRIIKGMLDSKRVKSLRIKAHRSLRGFRLPAGCSREERREIEYVIRTALLRLQDEFEGEYISICDLSEGYKNRLAARMLLPDPTTPAITCSGRARDWPEARGIYLSHDKSFTVIVNEADHLQVVLLSKEKELATVFKKFTRGLSALEEELTRNGETFAWDGHLGFITSDPACLGTGLHVQVRLRLRRLSVDNRLHYVLKKLKLKRTRKGIPSIDIHKGDIYVCCFKTLGVTEVEMINTLIVGISTLLQLETLLENGEDIDRYIYTAARSGQVPLHSL